MSLKRDPAEVATKYRVVKLGVGHFELHSSSSRLTLKRGGASLHSAEIVSQLCFREVVDLVGEICAHAPDSARVGIDGLGLQALELEMLEVHLVLQIKLDSRLLVHAG